MNTKKCFRSRCVAPVIVIVLVITLMSTCLVFNAGAVKSGLTINETKTFTDTVYPAYPTSLSAGEVWTGKTVSSADPNFGDANNGQFGVTLLALGGRIESGDPLFSPPGLTFNDTFKNDYAFVEETGSGIPIYIDGVKQIAILGTPNTYTYDDGNGNVVIFNTLDKTVTYTITNMTLNKVVANTTIPADACNTLTFGIVLTDSAATVGIYNTNEKDPGSCTASFNATPENQYYHTPKSATTYTNWQDITNTEDSASAFSYTPGGTEEVPYISVLKYIDFYGLYRISTPNIDFSSLSADGTHDVWVNAGTYTVKSYATKLMDTIKFDTKYVFSYDPLTHVHSYKSGTIQKLVTAFTVDKAPGAANEEAQVTLTGDGTVYTGYCTSFSSAALWSFTLNIDLDTYLITFSGTTPENSVLTVTNEGHWNENTIEGSYVSHVHDAYGYVSLTTPYTPPVTPNPPTVTQTNSLTVTKSVSGDGASTNEKFSITVVFTPNNASIVPFTGATGSNGTYTLALSAADGPVTFTNVPVGTAYTVTENISDAQKTAGWAAGSSTNTSGTISNDGAQATVTNVYTAAAILGDQDKEPQPSPSEEAGVAGASDFLPQTGGISSSTIIGLLGLVLVSIGGTTFVISRKKFLSK